MAIRRLDDKSLGQILCGLINTRRSIIFEEVKYDLKELAILYFVKDVAAEQGKFPSRDDLAQYLGLGHDDLNDKNGAYKKLIQNGLLNETNKHFQVKLYMSISHKGYQLCEKFNREISIYVDALKYY